MFEELMKQVRRLFSSKINGGKLVYKLTDRLHYYKQTLLALSLVLLLGYSNFRDHFKCQGSGSVDGKTTTTFCLINGTTTLDVIDSTGQKREVLGRGGPHVGLHYAPTREGQLELITHNYMRDLWPLLISMAICSYIAQRSWASIFKHETLRALLKLPGHQDLAVVKRAQESKVYDSLRKLVPPTSSRKMSRADEAEARMLSKKLTNLLEQDKSLFHTIDILAGDENECNKSLDYYPNQLIYMLIASKASAYKLAGLKLRRRLIQYSILSFTLTLMQFVVPWLTIGSKYTFYGFDYAKAWLRYTLKQVITMRADINTLDYMLSSRIWPTSTQCTYSQYGNQGMDSVTVQCTSAINEICGKLFVVIWWFIFINIIVEFCSLVWMLASSINVKTTRWFLGRKSWPKTRKEAQQVAKFRYKRALILHQHEKLLTDSNQDEDQKDADGHPELTERQKKILEAEAERQKKISSQASLSDKKWYLWCSRDICMFLTNQGKKIGSATGILVKGNSNPLRDEEGFKEVEEDQNIYYLLHLLYRRLNCSDKKTQQVVRMTSGALSNYLDYLKKYDEFAERFEAIENKDKSPELDPVSMFGTPTGQDAGGLATVGIKPSGGTGIDVMM